MGGVSITLNNVTNLANQTTAENTINTNSASITTAFASALNNQGDQMEGQLDMNSNHIVNLPAPTSNTEPLRVIDAATLNGNGTINVEGMPAGGSTGAVLTKNSSTNYDVAWESLPGFNPGSSSIPLSSISPESGYTLVGNPTSGSAVPTAFTIAGLTNKASPTGSDLLLISDQAASSALKYSTITQAIAATTAGVTSVESQTGSVTLSDQSGGTVTGSGGVVYLEQPGGFRNKFRNGTMDIWQRGTTISATTAGVYTADGWVVKPSGATMTVTQQAGRTGGNTLYSLQVAGATSGTTCQVYQRIESILTPVLASTNCTVQAQIFNNTGSSFTPTLTVSHATAGVDNWSSSSIDVNAVSLQACANNAWTLVSYTFAANASTNGMQIQFNIPATLNSGSVTFKITELDVRSTPGIASTGLQSFPPQPELRFISEELPLCRRYYQTSYPLGTVPGSNTRAGLVLIGFGGDASLSETNNTQIIFPVEMRATPTISYWDGVGNASTYSQNTGGTTWTDDATFNTANVQTNSRGWMQFPDSQAQAAFVAYAATAEL